MSDRRNVDQRKPHLSRFTWYGSGSARWASYSRESSVPAASLSGVLGFTDSHRNGGSDTEVAAKRLKAKDQDNLALALQYSNSTIPEFSVIDPPGSPAVPMWQLSREASINIWGMEHLREPGTGSFGSLIAESLLSVR